MQEKIMKVYYGIDRLPYKDEQRQVHYPVVGSLITGENNTTKIYFYVGLIGGVNRQWVANIKKPDGTLAYQLLTNGQSVDDDFRVVLDISSLYVDQVGEVKIGVQGYDSSANIVLNEETDQYEISGNPTIVATGTISIMANYAPSVLAKGETLTPTELQLLISAIGGKVDKESTILTFDNFPQPSDFEEGQIIFVKNEGKFYEQDGGTWEYIDLTDYDLIDKLNSLVYVAENRFNLPTFENGKLVYFKDSRTLEKWDAQASNFVLLEDVPTMADDIENIKEEIQHIKDKSDVVDVVGTYADLQAYDTTDLGDNDLIKVLSDSTHDNKKTYYRYSKSTDSFTYVGAETEITEDDVEAIVAEKASKVSVSSTGTATDEINYITIDGVEKKIAGSGGTGAVESVNGKTGEVVLTAQDIALENEETTIEDKFGEVDNTTDDLQDQISNLQNRGRYLSNWNATTGLPMTEPSTELPYEYRQGDYYIVGTVGTTNYKPTGSQYTGVASTSVETIELAVGDEYIYDGDEWVFQKNAPIDLDNYVDKTSDEDVGGIKTFSSGEIHFKNASGNETFRIRANDNDLYIQWYDGSTLPILVRGDSPQFRTTLPQANNTYDLGSSAQKWKDLYLSGTAYLGNNLKITDFSTNNTYFNAENKTVLFYCNNISPASTTINLGQSGRKWKDLYLSGKLSDGTNEITIANIQAKGSIQTSAEATFSGSLTSNNEYQFTTPLTSLNITSLVVASGDTMPRWEINFTAGANLVVSLPNTISWKYGTPTFETGEEYTIYIKGNYAYLI